MAKKNALAVVDFGDHEGEGFEGQSGDDIAIPFISVIQTNSPQVDKEDAKFIKGASAGMLLNSVTDEFVEKMLFVPACTKHIYVEWAARDSGGGFIGTHEIHSDFVKQAKIAFGSGFGKIPVPGTNNHLVETFQIYGVICNGKDLEPAVFSFSSTKIKVYKKANTKWRKMQVESGGRKISPPLFSHLTEITTKGERNAKGSWYNPVLTPAKKSLLGSLIGKDDIRFQAAAELKAMVQSGAAEAVYEGEEGISRDAAEVDPF